MRNLLALLILGICLCYSPALAWQDPCSATQYNYIYEDYALINWEESPAYFSPAPDCAGTVILLTPEGFYTILDYEGNGNIITIAGIPCRVNDKGDLICKVITQPEESTILYLKKENNN